MADLIKVGVVGTGALGRHHARLYAQNPNAEVVGIYDANTESAQKVGSEFNLPVFTDLDQLAAQCDAFSVAVPATYHAQVVLGLLAKGKHVLVEKPIAVTADEARAMVDAAKKGNLVFGVGHTERFSPSTDFLDKFSGRTRFVEARRFAAYPPARPGLHRRGTEVSVTLDLMVHDIDLVLHTIDSEVVDIDVCGTPVLSDSNDVVSVRLKFADGSRANLTASRVSGTPERTLKVFKEDCFLSLDYAQHCGTVSSVKDGEVVTEEFKFEEKNALAAELDDFIRAVAASRASGKVQETAVTGIHGLRALELAIRIDEAAAEFRKQLK